MMPLLLCPPLVPKPSDQSDLSDLSDPASRAEGGGHGLAHATRGWRLTPAPTRGMHGGGAWLRGSV